MCPLAILTVMAHDGRFIRRLHAETTSLKLNIVLWLYMYVCINQRVILYFKANWHRPVFSVAYRRKQCCTDVTYETSL